MKKIFYFVIAVLLLIPSLSFAATHVSGYYRKSGTYVQPYYRSDSNYTKADNYSSRGNYNPYTGKKGYKSY